MKPEICQSCGQPMLATYYGTNRDKTRNKDYCTSCFAKGEFTNPSLTLHQLEIMLLERAEIHNEISLEEAQQLIRILPTLKRWRMASL